MKQIRAEAEKSPELKEAFVLSVQKPIDLVKTLFSRLSMNDTMFKVRVREWLYVVAYCHLEVGSVLVHGGGL